MEWFDEETGTVKETTRRIKVIGVGGGGGNTVSSLFDSFNPYGDSIAKGIDFIIINSDSQDLSKSNVPDRIQIAQDGQGAGSDPELGRKFAEKCAIRIKDSVKNAYMVFVTAGMGGGTGTGASPVVARLARETNSPDTLIIGVVTTPFSSKKNKRSCISWTAASAHNPFISENLKKAKITRIQNRKRKSSQPRKLNVNAIAYRKAAIIAR